MPSWAPFYIGRLELKYYKKHLKTTESCEITRRFSRKEENNGAVISCKHLLPKSDCIFLQCKHIVSKYDDFIIPSLMKLNQELAGSEFIWVHGVQQYPFLCFDSYVFSIKFRWHWAPNLELKNIHTCTHKVTLHYLFILFPWELKRYWGGWQCIITFCIAQATGFNTVISVLKWKLLAGVVPSTAKLFNLINILAFHNASAARSMTEIGSRTGTGLEDISVTFHIW